MYPLLHCSTVLRYLFCYSIRFHSTYTHVQIYLFLWETRLLTWSNWHSCRILLTFHSLPRRFTGYFPILGRRGDHCCVPVIKHMFCGQCIASYATSASRHQYAYADRPAAHSDRSPFFIPFPLSTCLVCYKVTDTLSQYRALLTQSLCVLSCMHAFSNAYMILNDVDHSIVLEAFFSYKVLKDEAWSFARLQIMTLKTGQGEMSLTVHIYSIMALTVK